MTDTPGIRRAPAPCSECGQPAEVGKPRCKTHQAIVDASDNAQHNADRTYYHTAEWARLRTACVRRDFNQCALCGGTHYLAAHHIVARKDGGPDKLDNLVTLCARCHGKVERGEPDTTARLEAFKKASPSYREPDSSTFGAAWGIE